MFGDHPPFKYLHWMPYFTFISEQQVSKLSGPRFPNPLKCFKVGIPYKQVNVNVGPLIVSSLVAGPIIDETHDAFVSSRYLYQLLFHLAAYHRLDSIIDGVWVPLFQR